MNDRDHLAFLMHDVSRLFRSRFDERARTLGVTRQQWRVLMNLRHHPGRSQAELADALDVERITLCRMIDRLAEAGLVERRADPADRRIWRLFLLAPAQAIVGELTEIGARLEAEALDAVGGTAHAAVIDSLIRIRDALGGGETDRQVA